MSKKVGNKSSIEAIYIQKIENHKTEFNNGDMKTCVNEIAIDHNKTKYR